VELAFSVLQTFALPLGDRAVQSLIIAPAIVDWPAFPGRRDTRVTTGWGLRVQIDSARINLLPDNLRECRKQNMQLN
jgi:hypothetical protein